MTLSKQIVPLYIHCDSTTNSFSAPHHRMVTKIVIGWPQDEIALCPFLGQLAIFSQLGCELWIVIQSWAGMALICYYPATTPDTESVNSSAHNSPLTQ